MSQPPDPELEPGPALLPPGFLRDPVHLLAFGLGSGCAARAPGTWGSLAALPFYGLLVMLPLTGYLAVVAVTFLVGVFLCGRTARNLGVHDHSGIVWDEFVGVWIALAAQPVQGIWILAGVALFRFFDILKPWPIGWIDRRVSGGLGIMLDDVLAGGYAWAVLALMMQWA